jgi:uncharacterized protein YlxP (DUF503 family)
MFACTFVNVYLPQEGVQPRKKLYQPLVIELSLFCVCVRATQATDPFSRKPLSIAMVAPNTELAERIRRWKATGGQSEAEG